jgi:catechol 2,3-dioxygenase-like lactoylglutathione lyase family enzyme
MGQTAAMSVVPTYSHFGICVGDLERSIRFYCEGLGFEAAESHDVGREYSPLVELPEVSMTTQFLRNGPTAIELLAFANPGPVGPRQRRAMNQFGLTHLAFYVRGVDAAAARLAELGGTVVPEGRITLDMDGHPLEFVQCTDPDGVRIELMDIGDLGS